MKLTEQQIAELKEKRKAILCVSGFLQSYIFDVAKIYGEYSGMVEDYLYGNASINELTKWMDDDENNSQP